MSYRDRLREQIECYEARKKKLLKEIAGIDEVIETTKKKLEETETVKKITLHSEDV